MLRKLEKSSVFREETTGQKCADEVLVIGTQRERYDSDLTVL